jgi:antitoxin (DNA-binding transcriptional repressor) of toxin-antitoxin stability system
METLMLAISSTELARKTREVLDKVAGFGETVHIERNHILIAKMVPPTPTMTAAQALAGLKLPMLTPEQAASWMQDSRDGFDDAVRDPWA